MAGHSKWNNIKHKKAAEDQKKAHAFSRISKLIRSAVRQGGSGDPEQNYALRPILDKARAANMPKDKIQKAIDVGLGKGENGPLKEVVYEGFTAEGLGLIIVALTDNPKRTAPEVRTILSRAGGSLGSTGCAAYMFERQQDRSYKCIMPLEVKEAKQQENLKDLVDELMDLEDVQDVYLATNDVLVEES